MEINMRENIHNHPACEGMNNGINWVCKICKDLPNYARMYLHQRKKEKNQLNNEKNRYADLIQVKYYYALLYLLDKIHELHECPNLENILPECADQKCSTPKYFDYYRKIYNIYKNILISEKEINQLNLRCDICAVLPYAIFNDLNMIAKNMYGDDIERTQKLELKAMIADYYLEIVGSCKEWDECSRGVDWLELMKSVQMLKKYLEMKDCKELQISLSEWNRVRSIDNILNAEIRITCRDFQTMNISPCVLKEKMLVYMDFGVYQLYESNNAFRTQVDNYTEMDKIQFVYSPVHMEEVGRMGNTTYESERRNNISKICGNCEVPVDQGRYLKILTESVEVCFDRVKKFQNLNQRAEELECAKFENLEERVYELFGWDEKEAEKNRKKISDIESTQLFDPKDKTIDNEGINRIFYEICNSSFPVENFKDYCKKERTFSKIREAVQLFFTLMNALGYHRNKIEKRTKFTYRAFYPTYDRKFYRTIKSGFYDIEHICYATKCNYFVTCDHTLSLQATEIYRYLGCKTNVYYIKK